MLPLRVKLQATGTTPLAGIMMSCTLRRGVILTESRRNSEAYIAHAAHHRDFPGFGFLLSLASVYRYCRHPATDSNSFDLSRQPRRTSSWNAELYDDRRRLFCHEQANETESWTRQGEPEAWYSQEFNFY